MELSQKAIVDFAAIWKREFGETLTPERAETEAKLFLQLCWLFAQPLPGEPGHTGASPTP